ncbi:acetyl-CoA C-acetyltransferase [Sulfobacillus sp. hq2]|uniref:acetyl-CoA C-acetyltransferase n=1 Tax=Sulfobacillus TaxID=28033 RepID=UPI000CD0C049|nr:acetyl-CoA C-acetyltransferase [Sulfobacillus sp. hq2]POB10383.1 acetyl-CoA C-acyltransferase [Sulfobacillus sp. hq2]
MLVSRSTEIYLLAGARTPFGTYGGTLKDIDSTELGRIAAEEAIRRAGLEPAHMDFAIVGNVLPSSPDAAYTARHVALNAGMSLSAPALTVNRLCGSGLQAAISAAQSLVLGEGQVALAGGTENMSQAPFHLRNSRFGVKAGAPVLTDGLLDVLTDMGCGLGMGATAENLAEQYGITREAQDAYAALSQARAYQAQVSGRLQEEIVPVPVRVKGQITEFALDEHMRPGTTVETLAHLKPAFKTPGTVTAGNASGINDGSAMLVLATGDFVQAHGLRPLARIVSYGVAGVDPRIMGIGPVPASRIALENAGLDIEDVGLVEINEAFASQYLAVEQELGLDRDKTNVNGGAIALGHPVGASGARLLLTLALEMRRRHQQFGLASLCIGGGQGIACVIESV